MEVMSGMPFLTLSNADFQFGAEKLTWRSYTIVKALLITSRVEFINKREFAKAALSKNLETFVIHVSALDVTKSLIHLSWVAQIAVLQ